MSGAEEDDDDSVKTPISALYESHVIAAYFHVRFIP